MKLLANGCSMTHGQELVTNGYDPANTELCYAKMIYDHFGGLFSSYENIALPGVSNKHIVESTLDYLIANEPSNTFVLIGWTSPIRYCFTHNDHYVRFNIHNPPSEGDHHAGPDITEFHKQFRLHMNDGHDLSRTFFHEVNYLATWLDYAGVPYAMSYFFEEPGYNQSRRRNGAPVPHWTKKSNEPLNFGEPDARYLYRHNILEVSHWHSLQRASKEFGNVWASGRHPNLNGHKHITQRLIPLVENALNTI